MRTFVLQIPLNHSINLAISFCKVLHTALRLEHSKVRLHSFKEVFKIFVLKFQMRVFKFEMRCARVWSDTYYRRVPVRAQRARFANASSLDSFWRENIQSPWSSISTAFCVVRWLVRLGLERTSSIDAYRLFFQWVIEFLNTISFSITREPIKIPDFSGGTCGLFG